MNTLRIKTSCMLILIAVLAFASSAFSYAAEKQPQEPVPFKFVTSELEDFQPDNEYSITFEKTITINAETVKGAKVKVAVDYDEGLEEEPVVYEEVFVGATMKIIQPVALNVGDNLIEISIEKEGFEATIIEVLVKRKSGAIIEALQNMIVIPGIK